MTAPIPETGTATSRRWTRRRFLKVSAAGGGALILGFSATPLVSGYRRRAAIRATATATGEFRPNAWLAIHPDERIVFTLDRVEMGQGTMTSHTMLIAEELEVDPRAIEVEFAVADRRYIHPEMMLQITGGSSSVRTSWEQLRYAGAVAREMLRAAAAEAWEAPLGECAAERGAIVHRPSGKRRTYGSLTRLAAEQPIPDPPLKNAAACALIGTSIDRLDAPRKVDGSAIFGIDVQVPDAVAAVIIRPPLVGATVKSFEAGDALARRGVRAVVDIPGGVAVVADTYWQARAAADAVRVAWEGGRANLDTATLSDELRALTAAPGKAVRDDGDAEAALAAAGRTIEAAYEAPHLAHAPMEPQNCTARVEGDRCEIWAPTQAPGVARDLVATALDLPLEHVTVHTTFIGGGFGRRLVSDFVLEAAHVARRIGQPVKVVWSREDDMRHSVYRPQVRHALRAALGEDGWPAAWRHRVAAPSLLVPVLRDFLPALTPGVVPRAVDRGLTRLAGGVFSREWVADFSSTEGASDTAYAIPNLRVELALHDAGVPIGFWRSVGHSHTAFAVESFIDELAAAAGRDPYEFRRALLRDAPRHRAVLEAAGERAGWGAPLPAGVGRGIAQHYSFETYVAQVAEVSVADDRIRVHRVVCAVDCGRVVNPDIVRAQMEGGIVFGLSAALKQRISYAGGAVDQSNFHDYPMLRMNEMPEIDVVILDSDAEPTGVGEPGVPPIAPAVANALAAATGRRIRTLPIEREWART
jgi:CO/xanthine dehydrogenase Mo-binding subunit